MIIFLMNELMFFAPKTAITYLLPSLLRFTATPCAAGEVFPTSGHCLECYGMGQLLAGAMPVKHYETKL